MNKSVVELKQVTKIFGSVVANEDVDLTLKSGEIHALLGENGAGKSTLMNMLSGIYAPDSGSISIRGEKVQLSSPKSAIAHGVGMVHQHFKLVESFTAKENIIAGTGGEFFSKSHKSTAQIEALCDKYGFQLALDKKVFDMSVSEKQMLEIIKVIYRGCDILILDEPTAVLTPQEVEMLFAVVRRMKAEGCAVVIITHKLGEVMSLCDTVTVLRKGKVAATVDIPNTSPAHLTELMVGHSEKLEITREEVQTGKVVYEVKDLLVKRKDGARVLDQVSFELRSGEILGIAGVAGSGQKELCEVMAGLIGIDQGELNFEGESLVGKSPREIHNKGVSLSFIPEDRLGMGLVGSMGMTDNLLLKDYHTQKGWKLNRDHLAKQAEALIKKLSIRTPNINHPVKMLSGGNIQKVLLGREIECNPHVLITAYAVRGLDIGATHQIYDLINEQKRKGVGVLFVGEDLDVLMQLCDRIMVMCHGEVTGIVKADEVTKEQLGLMMAGEKMAAAREVEHAS
ncbi:MAG: ABC transporter ATP-binding protein [Cellulosilyticaceae bacterium]